MARSAADHATYTVSYDSESHWAVLTQMRGSMWPKVIPYCLFNVFMMLLLHFLDKRYEARLNIEVSNQGHTFMTLIVAFLLVSRVNIALARYNAARDNLGTMYREGRELIQNACVFSEHDKKGGPAWRNELAYRSLLLLRTVMAVIDYPDTNSPAWDLPELSGEELDDIKKSIFLSPENRRWMHSERSEWEETMRVPIRIAYLLRKTIHNQSKQIKPEIQISQENKLLSSVDGFMVGYYGMRKFLTTPVPFPLVQMARTFVFLYVFTIPFVLLSDSSSIVAHCCTVFVITFGFMGLESTSIELDNPFGDDPNDFNNLGMAYTAFEDTYMTILDVDGVEWTDTLRAKMHDHSPDRPLSTEQSWLLSKIL